LQERSDKVFRQGV